MKRTWLVALLLAALATNCANAKCEEPLSVSVCDLNTNRAVYDHKLIEVEGFISHDFEDFTLFDPSCESRLSIWVEYGGKRKSDTVYCCGPTSGKSRPQDLIVENIALPLTEDDVFQAFDREVQPPFRSGHFGSVVHAKLLGRLFAGRQVTVPSGRKLWTGYGHVGCCSLFVIQKVLSVSPQDRDDLDYGASMDQPEIKKVGCGFSDITPREPDEDILDAQRTAEGDLRTTAFDDPKAVASKFLSVALNLGEASLPALRERRRGPGRIVYVDKNSRSMVVVSRLAWLTFYARDPKRITWAVAAAYVQSCERKNSVTRIK